MIYTSLVSELHTFSFDSWQLNNSTVYVILFNVWAENTKTIVWVACLNRKNFFKLNLYLMFYHSVLTDTKFVYIVH